MLTRALYLATTWFLISFIATILFGPRLRRANRLFSFAWLAAVLILGDVWALLSFDMLRELEVLTVAVSIIGVLWIWRMPDWNAFGHVAWITTLLASLLYLAYTFAITAFTPLHPLAFIAAMVFFFIELTALVLGLSFAFEGLDIVCRARWHRRTGHFRPIPGYTPKVSVHVPAYNEPPEVVAVTLRSLAHLDYPNYEVIVVDNNTPHEETWRSIKAICRELGPGFRFLHLDRWPGYKAGALNFALTQTAPDAEIIAICDADYRVDPSFLRETVSAFANPQIAFLQTPQDYGDWQGQPFLEACYYGYKYFFKVSMPSRNERNAIIFAGTMGLIRKSVLQEIGGWDEWCITEDAEASLRILKRGYQSIYVDKTYGRGLIPFDFDSLKKQRFRWCFGGIQILRKHWEALMPWANWVDPANHLTGSQRYYYLVGGLQWFNDLLNLLFTFFLILGAIISVIPGASGIRPLTPLLLVMPAIFLVIGLWRFLWVLRITLRLNWRTALQTMSGFFSLAWAVTLGSIQGLIQPRGVFLRTPKTEGQLGIVRAIRATQWETTIGLLCAFIGLDLLFSQPRISSIVLGCLLCWHASYFLAAPVYSILSLGTRAGPAVPAFAERPGIQIREGHAAAVVLIAVGLLLLGFGLVRFLPEPPKVPSYSQFRPPEIQPAPLFVPASVLTPTATTPVQTPRPASTAFPTPASTVMPTPTPDSTLAPTPIPSGTPVRTPAPTPQSSATPLPTTEPTPMPTNTLVPLPTNPPSPTGTPLPAATLILTLPSTATAPAPIVPTLSSRPTPTP